MSAARVRCLAAIACSTVASQAWGSDIDFEAIPGIDAPVDGMQISTHFLATHGVIFRLEGGGFPVLAKRGAPFSAFQSAQGVDEPVANPNQNVGDWFLADDPDGFSGDRHLLIELATPVDAMSGVVLDVDNDEVWTIEALADGVVVDSVVVDEGSPDAGDGLASAWALSSAQPDIDVVRIRQTGGSTPGVAFDNLSFSSLGAPPAPSTADIDFEAIPGFGVPEDRMEISTQFAASHGMTFSLEDGSFPEIAQVGAPRTAFAGPPNDTGSDNPQSCIDWTGAFFLTDDGMLAGQNPSPLIVHFAPPVSAASGMILDVDGDESFTITARDASDQTLATKLVQAGQVGAGSGVATPWLIALEEASIHSIRFEGTTTGNADFGLGFDRFNVNHGRTPPSEDFEGDAPGTLPGPPWLDAEGVAPTDPSPGVPSVTVEADTDALGDGTQVASLAPLVSEYPQGLYRPVPVASEYCLSVDLRVDQFSSSAGSKAPYEEWPLDVAFLVDDGTVFADARQAGVYASSVTQEFRVFALNGGKIADVDLGASATADTWYRLDLGVDAMSGMAAVRIMELPGWNVVVDTSANLASESATWNASDAAYNAVAFFDGDSGADSPNEAVWDNVVLVPEPGPIVSILFGICAVFGLGWLRARTRLR